LPIFQNIELTARIFGVVKISFDTNGKMSGAFPAMNPNNKIPAMVDPDGSEEKP